METIADAQFWIDRAADDCIQGRRMLALAEVTCGLGSPDYRKARLGLRRSESALECAQYQREYAREQLARMCEPWFRLEA